MPSTPAPLLTDQYRAWHRRSAAVAFREPISRFIDVVILGVIGGATLLFAGAPDGPLYLAAAMVWHAGPHDEVAVSGSLAQVTLTVWALVVSIGGATYIEASRTIRTDSRTRARVLNAGREHLGAQPASFTADLPADLAGSLREIALDTPSLLPQLLTSEEALPALARKYELTQDYWNRRSGYFSDINATWTAADAARCRLLQHRRTGWRLTAVAAVVLALVSYATLGLGNLLAPLLLTGGLAARYRARLQLLDRFWLT